MLPEWKCGGGGVENRLERVEVRLTAIETGLIHVRSDLSALKEHLGEIALDLRDLRGTQERRFQAVATRFTRHFRWLVSILITFGATMLAVMAKGFHWI